MMMSFPQTLDPTFPQTSGLTRQGDNEVRDFKQFLVDVLGLPENPTNMTSAATSITSGGIVTFPNTRVEVDVPLFITKNIAQENNFINPYVRFGISNQRTLENEFLVSAGRTFFPTIGFKIYICFRVPNYFDINHNIYLDFNYFQTENEAGEVEATFYYKIVSSGDNIEGSGQGKTGDFVTDIDYKLNFYQHHPESLSGTQAFKISTGEFSVGDTIQCFLDLFFTQYSPNSTLHVTNFRFIQYLQEELDE
jgi:hypothetical protein